MRIKVALGLMVALLLAVALCHPGSGTVPLAKGETSDGRITHPASHIRPRPPGQVRPSKTFFWRPLRVRLIPTAEAQLSNAPPVPSLLLTWRQCSIRSRVTPVLRPPSYASSSCGAGPRRTRLRQRHGPHSSLMVPCAVPPSNRSPSPGQIPICPLLPHGSKPCPPAKASRPRRLALATKPRGANRSQHCQWPALCRPGRSVTTCSFTPSVNGPQAIRQKRLIGPSRCPM